MSLGHGVGDDCSFPPGLAWEIEHCLPVIPVPQWERYLRTGAFNPGIQRILEQTAHCHHYDAVVVDGRIIELEEPIHGVFPPGWHRGPCMEAEPDNPRPPRTPGAWPDYELDRSLPGGSSRYGCLTGRTLDLLVPYPLEPMTVRFPDGSTADLAEGEMGSLVLRIPGDGHPLANTGMGFLFSDRRFFSEQGHRVWDRYDSQRTRELNALFRERTTWIHLWVRELWGRRAIGQWTAPYQRTHMACPKNHYPHHGWLVEAGLAGRPVAYRWAQSRSRVPLPPTATDNDSYQEYFYGWGGQGNWIESFMDYDPDNRRWSSYPMPEQGSVIWDFTHPPADEPGKYLVGGAASSSLSVGRARYSPRVGCGDCRSGQVDGLFDFLDPVKDFLKSAVKKIITRIEKILPNELEEVLDKIAPIASVALPPPFGTAAKAYQAYRSAVQSGDYDQAAQITKVLQDHGLPDPLDIAEGKVDPAAHPKAQDPATNTTGTLGTELARTAGSLGLAAGAVAAGALVLKSLPRASRFQASFRRRR